MVRVSVRGWAAVLIGLLSLPFAAEAQNVPFSTDTQGGYARLLMEFPSPPTFEARIENGVLVVRFDSPFDMDVALLSRALPRYVSLVRQDPDRRALRLALKQNFRLQTSAAANQVAIDLIPFTFAGTPPPLDPDAALAEQDEPIIIEDGDFGPIEIRPLSVRVGRQAEFSRIVFEWPQRVAYDAQLKDRVITLNFAKAADPNIVGLRVDPPQYVKTADKSIKANTLKVTIEIDPDAGMRHYREDDHVVVDVLSPKLVALRNDEQALTGNSEVPEQGPINLATNLRRAEAAEAERETAEAATDTWPEDASANAEAKDAEARATDADAAQMNEPEMRSSLVTPTDDERQVVGAVVEGDVPPTVEGVNPIDERGSPTIEIETGDTTSAPMPAAETTQAAVPAIDPGREFCRL